MKILKDVLVALLAAVAATAVIVLVFMLLSTFGFLKGKVICSDESLIEKCTVSIANLKSGVTCAKDGTFSFLLSDLMAKPELYSRALDFSATATRTKASSRRGKKEITEVWVGEKHCDSFLNAIKIEIKLESPSGKINPKPEPEVPQRNIDEPTKPHFVRTVPRPDVEYVYQNKVITRSINKLFQAEWLINTDETDSLYKSIREMLTQKGTGKLDETAFRNEFMPKLKSNSEAYAVVLANSWEQVPAASRKALGRHLFSALLTCENVRRSRSADKDRNLSRELRNLSRNLFNKEYVNWLNVRDVSCAARRISQLADILSNDGDAPTDDRAEYVNPFQKNSSAREQRIDCFAKGCEFLNFALDKKLLNADSVAIRAAYSKLSQIVSRPASNDWNLNDPNRPFKAEWVKLSSHGLKTSLNPDERILAEHCCD